VLAPYDSAVDGTLQDDGVDVRRFRYFPLQFGALAYGSGILPNLRKAPWLMFQLPFFGLAAFFSLVRHSIRYKPNVIHAHWILPAGLLAVLVGRMLNIPVVTTAHGGDAYSLSSTLFRWLKRYALKSSARWTSNTYATANASKQGISVGDAAIIPMGVDTDMFGSGERAIHRKGYKNTDLIFLFVGRLVEKKGCDVLIKAFGRVLAQSPDGVYLWVVGDGQLFEDLSKLAVKIGIHKRIIFFGRIENTSLPDIYAGADCFVLPSIENGDGDTEGQGVVLLEAMAAGLPIVASRVGGVSEIVKDGQNGWLVEPADEVLLAEKMTECIGSQAVRCAVSRKAKIEVESYS